MMKLPVISRKRFEGALQVNEALSNLVEKKYRQVADLKEKNSKLEADKKRAGARNSKIKKDNDDLKQQILELEKELEKIKWCFKECKEDNIKLMNFKNPKKKHKKKR